MAKIKNTMTVSLEEFGKKAGRDENGRNIYRCSECNFEVEVFSYNLISWRTHEKYCPGCGARMDGDSDD